MSLFFLWANLSCLDSHWGTWMNSSLAQRPNQEGRSCRWGSVRVCRCLTCLSSSACLRRFLSCSRTFSSGYTSGNSNVCPWGKVTKATL
uniref:Putative secreted protein n=1 Tax=Ixodes ricinus TaxID=34613 RepID=A0A6B0UB53_IXORI